MSWMTFSAGANFPIVRKSPFWGVPPGLPFEASDHFWSTSPYQVRCVAASAGSSAAIVRIDVAAAMAALRRAGIPIARRPPLPVEPTLAAPRVPKPDLQPEHLDRVLADDLARVRCADRLKDRFDRAARIAEGALVVWVVRGPERTVRAD